MQQIAIDAPMRMKANVAGWLTRFKPNTSTGLRPPTHCSIAKTRAVSSPYTATAWIKLLSGLPLVASDAASIPAGVAAKKGWAKNIARTMKQTRKSHGVKWLASIPNFRVG